MEELKTKKCSSCNCTMQLLFFSHNRKGTYYKTCDKCRNKTRKESMHNKAIKAVLDNNKDEVILYKNAGAWKNIYEMDTPMELAALKGYKDLVLLFKEWGATGYYRGMWNAAWGGHKDLVLLFKEWAWGESNYRWKMTYDCAMVRAADKGYKDLVLLFKEWGATDYDSGMVFASANNHKELVLLFKEWGATDYEAGMASAASGMACRMGFAASEDTKGGHKELILLFKEWGATDYNRCMSSAAYIGNKDTVLLFEGWGATGYISAIKSAALNGQYDLFVFLRKKWAITHNDLKNIIKETYIYICQGNSTGFRKLTSEFERLGAQFEEDGEFLWKPS